PNTGASHAQRRHQMKHEPSTTSHTAAQAPPPLASTRATVAAPTSRVRNLRARTGALGLVWILVALTAACTGGTTASDAANSTRIVALSNRADLVSGDDALVAVILPKGVDASKVRVTVGDNDASQDFSASNWQALAPSLSTSYSRLDPTLNA